MIAKQDTGFYVLKLEKGEDIEKTLFDFCRKNEIFSGYLHGIGALASAEIAIYDLKNQSYRSQRYAGDLEIVSLFGTVSKPKIHIHITIGMNENQLFGGHLLQSEISIAGEIILVPGNLVIERKLDDTSGLPLMEF